VSHASEPSTTRVVLVRHGQSRATVDGVAGGRSGCTGLTDLGRRQAQALADRLAATAELEGATALLSSTLPRAVETAETIAPALGGLPVEQLDDLCELDPGEGDGLTWDEWQERYGGFDLGAEPYRPLAPGGESWAEFQLRAGRVLSELATTYAGGTVVASCHGGIIEASMVNELLVAAQVPPGQRIVTAANGSLTEWRVTVHPYHPQHWRLVRFNDVAHLRPDGEPRRLSWA